MHEFLGLNLDRCALSEKRYPSFKKVYSHFSHVNENEPEREN